MTTNEAEQADRLYVILTADRHGEIYAWHSTAGAPGRWQTIGRLDAARRYLRRIALRHARRLSSQRRPAIAVPVDVITGPDAARLEYDHAARVIMLRYATGREIAGPNAGTPEPSR